MEPTVQKDNDMAYPCHLMHTVDKLMCTTVPKLKT